MIVAAGLVVKVGIHDAADTENDDRKKQEQNPEVTRAGGRSDTLVG